MRAPFQVLIFPFYRTKNNIEYAIFERADMVIWQGIAGGGENDETPLQAAVRETKEESGLDMSGSAFMPLSTLTTIPASNIQGLLWGESVIMIPEFSYGLEVAEKSLLKNIEHKSILWVSKDLAMKKLKYDSNKSAIWELDFRLKSGNLDSGKNTKKIIEYLATRKE